MAEHSNILLDTGIIISYISEISNDLGRALKIAENNKWKKATHVYIHSIFELNI